MADFRFSVIEHGRFSGFGNRAWPIFDFRVLNIAKSCNSLIRKLIPAAPNHVIHLQEIIPKQFVPVLYLFCRETKGTLS